MFVIVVGQRTAERAGYRTAGCAGPGDKSITGFNEGDTAAAFGERRGVHAGDDHAPRAGG